MATFNGEKYLQEQLDSIARQNLLPLELVITDDGSTDTTLEIAEAFARNAPFEVRVFRNETRLGYADNFLKAASLCRGNLIAFCDQDDIWLEQKLRVCANFFDDPEVLLTVHSAQLLLGHEKSSNYYPHFLTTRIFDRCPLFANRPGFAMVIHKALLPLAVNGKRPARFASHDHWLWFLAAASGKIATLADVLTLYRQHERNVFGSPQSSSIVRRARSIAGTTAYVERADFENECSRILLVAAEEYPGLSKRLTNSARRLEYQARLHRIRHQLYSNDSNLLRRVRAFLHILTLAGYLPDASRSRLGPRAAIKDLFLGVPGVYRLFRSRLVLP